MSQASATPPAELGDIAWLPVIAIDAEVALLDWGWSPALPLPRKEQLNKQLQALRVGDYCLVKIFRDDDGNMLASEYINDFIANTATEFEAGDKVDVVITETTDLGMKVVVNSRYWGLLYRDEIFAHLTMGDKVTGYVKKLRADNKLDITLSAPGFARVTGATGDILTMLGEHEGFMPFTDKTSPEEIYSVFGMSKKVFKQAIGTLFKQRQISIDPDGIRLISAER